MENSLSLRYPVSPQARIALETACTAKFGRLDLEEVQRKLSVHRRQSAWLGRMLFEGRQPRLNRASERLKRDARAGQVRRAGRHAAARIARGVPDERARALKGACGDALPHGAPEEMRVGDHGLAVDAFVRLRQNLVGVALRAQHVAFAARAAHAKRVPRPGRREQIVFALKNGQNLVGACRGFGAPRRGHNRVRLGAVGNDRRVADERNPARPPAGSRLGPIGCRLRPCPRWWRRRARVAAPQSCAESRVAMRCRGRGGQGKRP